MALTAFWSSVWASAGGSDREKTQRNTTTDKRNEGKHLAKLLITPSFSGLAPENDHERKTVKFDGP